MQKLDLLMNLAAMMRFIGYIKLKFCTCEHISLYFNEIRCFNVCLCRTKCEFGIAIMFKS